MKDILQVVNGNIYIDPILHLQNNNHEHNNFNERNKNIKSNPNKFDLILKKEMEKYE